MTYEVAKLEDYGYKKRTGLKITWKIVRIILVIFTILMLYASIIIITAGANQKPGEHRSRNHL